MLRLGTHHDVDNIMKVIYDVVEKMINIDNIDQWTHEYPNRNVIIEDINHQQLYILEVNNNIVGIIVINEQVYDAYKQVKWNSNDDFRVLHRVCINPEYQGQGYGMMLYNEAINTIKGLGINYVKVDTFSLNDKMNKLILKVGFKYCGQMDLKENKPPWNCYDMLIK